MSAKTKIIVLKMKSLIFTTVMIGLGIILLILILTVVIPQNSKEGRKSVDTASYVPGVYTSSVQLNDTSVDVMVTVDENNINDVEKFKTMWLAIDQDQQQELDDHEFYFHEIIGLKVITTEKEELGVIKDILSLGSNDVWVIKRNKPKLSDALIPYIEDVVKEVNVDEGFVVIELMEGLIDDEN